MRLGDRLTLLTVASVVAVIVIADRCTPTPPALPARVDSLVARHEIANAVDTAMTNRLERDKLAANRRASAAAAAARASDTVAASERRRADSLEIVAKTSQTARDSADAWHAAYDARTRESDSLRAETKHLSVQVESVTGQLAIADSIGSTWRTHALRGDSVIAAVLPFVGSDQCRILRVVNCPTRQQATVAGLIIGSVTTAAALLRR